MIRTVGAFEAAGVAGIHIEDQVAPKKCGHMEGELVIPAQEMAQKIRAAAEARRQPEFVIIARTDARAVEGLERALDRGRLTALGYRIVIFPVSTLLAATAAMRQILREIARADTPAAAMPGLPTFGEFLEFIGMPQVHAAEQRYATNERNDPPPQDPA